MRKTKVVVAGLVLLGFLAGPATACSTQSAGAKCVAAPASYGSGNQGVRSASKVPALEAPTFEVGDTLPRGDYMLVLNTDRYGLPPASDGLVYFNVEGRALRVQIQTMKVVEDMTDLLRHRLP